jgi:hypothetical protein
MQRLTIGSANVQARIAGALYILVILLAGFAEVAVRQGLVAPGNVAATAHNIIAHESLFRLGFAAEAITNLIAIPVTLIVYWLLAPVSRPLAMTALVFDLTQNAINAVNAWTQFAPLTLLRPSPDLAAIPHDQLAAWARLALRWHDVGFDIALTFFGVALVIWGVLIFRSRFLPRWLGGLYGLAGVCYLANSFDYFLNLGLPPGLLLVCLVGESAFALWLLVVGIDDAEWRAAAA